MALPDFSQLQQQWKDNQAKIDGNISSLNSQIEASGSKYVRNPMNQNQLMMVSTGTDTKSQIDLQNAEITNVKGQQSLDPILSADEAGRLGKPYGTTQSQAKGAIPKTTAQLNAGDSGALIETLVAQIKAASGNVNTYNSIGNFSNPFQMIKGQLSSLLGDPDAKFLDKQVQGLLSPIAKDLLLVNRFNSTEIQALSQNMPKSTDTKQQAKVKLDRIDALMASKGLGDKAQSTTGQSTKIGGYTVEVGQ